MDSPCYDVERKIDCPRRCAGCSVECPDWAKYVAERDADYDKRLAESTAKTSYYADVDRRMKKFLKRKKTRYRSTYDKE